MTGLLFHNGEKLLLIGDSVTDCGRARPIGEGYSPAIGNGYASYVFALLSAVYPARQLRVINMGISGNTVRDLEARWTSDVEALQPDWLSILIGVNDVWRRFELPMHQKDHVPLNEYEATLERLVLRSLPQTQGIFLIAPFFVEALREEPMRRMIDDYAAAVQRIAKRNGCVFVDAPAAFDRAMHGTYGQSLALDRVHPTAVGHMLLAKTLLDAAGFRWDGED